MVKVYIMNDDGTTSAMQGCHCKNEDLELQRILMRNPDLIPGDQINPSDPRRWLVIKREMPVPDPSTGANRWSIDFLFADQDSMPTFIECKRYNDTRARREVVGQMIEYAANGPYYWSKDEIRTYAEETAKTNDLSLEEAIKRLQREKYESVDAFFQRVHDNLKEGQIRLVFFMEESPPELKSVVDFLNRQMERSEVLLVEARQYENEVQKIVIPILFGFTEEARKVKKTISVTTGQKRKWDDETFFANAKESLSEPQVSAIKLLYNKSQELGCEFKWGIGKYDGSFAPIWTHLGKNPVYHVYSDGKLQINYKSFEDHPEIIEFLKKGLNWLGLKETDYPTCKVGKWSEQVNRLLDMLESMLNEFPPQ